MNRRTFLNGSAYVAAVAGSGLRMPLVHAADYKGRFFVFVQADGGWDVTSFCDPKINQRGEAAINHWAADDEPRQAGNIWYAPFGNNEGFFENHYDKMLVINGVDAQTNSHTTGIIHNWSGRISEGFPTMTSLLASHYAPSLAVPYLNFGGFSETAGVARYTRLNTPGLLHNIAHPERVVNGDPYINEADWSDLKHYRRESAELLATSRGLMPMDERNRMLLKSAFANGEDLKAYASAIPPDSDLEEGDTHHGQDGTFRSELRRQAQLTVLGFKTRVAVAADLYLGGFDTHATHDPDHEWLLGQLTDGVSYLWEYAETHGIDDRLVVVMGSDFGRTNKYNSGEGKDHWPYGSFIVMEQNQPWTNRVVGETDELHYAYNIDPATLERVGDNDPNGTHIYPKHVHKALRRYLGIEDSRGARRFPFNNTEDFAFFA